MTVGRVVSLPRSGRRCTRSLRPQARRAAAWEDRDMHVTVTSGLLAAALLWATESIALEPKRPPSLPALDFSCYTSHRVAFTTLQSTGSELGIGGDNYGKPVYRFTTIGESMLKVVEFPEFDSMRKEYDKTIFELNFGNTGGDYIFGWSDNNAMGLRIFMINQRDRLVSLLEVPPSSQTLPFGTLRVLKCNDAAKAGPSPQNQEMASWSENAKGASQILDRELWRTSTATFPNRLPVRAQGSVSHRSVSGETAVKMLPPPLNHQAALTS